jgi:hypothetical protein
MKINRSKSVPGGIVLLLAIIACVLPGQTLFPALAPTANPAQIETFVAGTLQANATQTATAQFVPTETPVGMTGTTIEQAQDGTTKYIDYDGAFEITFPVGWLALHPNSDEFNSSLSGEGAANAMLHDQMTSDQAGYDAEFDRLYAYILRPDIEKNVILGFSKLAWDSEDTNPINNDTMGKVVDDLETSGVIPTFRASVVQLQQEGDITMIEIGGRWSMSDGQGGTILFFSTAYFFKPSPGSTVRIIFTVLLDYRDRISPDMEAIIKSIKIIEP